MKKWNKPVVKVVIIDEVDVVCSSWVDVKKTSANPNASFDDAKFNNQSDGIKWGRK